MGLDWMLSMVPSRQRFSEFLTHFLLALNHFLLENHSPLGPLGVMEKLSIWAAQYGYTTCG